MKVLILSPHTDDAELGCGGSIFKFLNRGDDIYWIVFSTAEDSLPKNLPKNTLREEFIRVVQSLNLSSDNYSICNFKVRYLHEHRQKILDKLIEVRISFNPDLVIGPSVNDFHQDHQIVANEMIRAFKTTSSIISYELPWNHVTFNTQLFIKLNNEHISKKCSLLRNYQSQFLKNRLYFSKEYIYGIGTTRGIQCNSKYAEAFEVVRWMI
ncbi:GlcNAc-PI de-N-acetylase [Methanosarcina mazei]|uniref:GlcNAc-PI de-N-acetylase n=1 Tax=Methanosarcina mazei TaxID=2209 RepID=A0A0F8Q6X0_METMZ|nr:PIG-L family deacetylase [Methanosarcina mazei]KKG07105.1 GlcNAc-PI de-N-acetylase [Methanosarcina mazei]KKH38031.1 GlcNAc-PI de-N-acetylase [Methanosarcina mazei]KKH38391.1 GlcNAc-PI de-N-acetylase [Methanosarcina mazei]KKH45998.1 GlcNAc-PI de-N-acetylase [Methanosarcina mazei]KKH54229.1 GlcNAc-PI de-N-acetylase [Methanosarcina mazei]